MAPEFVPAGKLSGEPYFSWFLCCCTGFCIPLVHSLDFMGCALIPSAAGLGACCLAAQAADFPMT